MNTNYGSIAFSQEYDIIQFIRSCGYVKSAPNIVSAHHRQIVPIPYESANMVYLITIYLTMFNYNLYIAKNPYLSTRYCIGLMDYIL